MKWRNITLRLEAALADTPVVFLHGARQTGKTTLARERSGSYFTFDDATVQAAARSPAVGRRESVAKRLTKAPKLHLCDASLAAHLTGATAERLAREPRLLGPLLETFVVAELRKQATWSTTPAHLFHFRTESRQEVDVVLEDHASRRHEHTPLTRGRRCVVHDRTPLTRGRRRIVHDRTPLTRGRWRVVHEQSLLTRGRRRVVHERTP